MAETRVLLTKTCVNCRIEKDSIEFHRHRGRKDGLSSICKECNKAKAKSWYHQNTERGKVTRRKYYEDNRDTLMRHFADNRAKNKERDRKAQKAWREANSQRKRDNDLRWHKQHPEKVRLYKRVNRLRRRQRIEATENQCSASQIRDLYVKQKGKCICCNTALRAKYHIDHIKPLSRGGDNSISNIQLLCQPCNGRKSAKDPFDFMRELGFLL